MLQITFTESQSGFRFFLDTYESDQMSLPGDRTAARFFLQASMGPTRSMVDAAEAAFETDGTTAAKNWLQTQIALPLTSHREYFRKRVNPRNNDEIVSYTAAFPNQPCNVGSRWHSWFLTVADVGKTMIISADAGHSVISIDGVQRTEAPELPIVGEVAIASCSASSELEGAECHKAFDDSNSKFQFRVNPLETRISTYSSTDQWIKLTFTRNSNIERFAWLNRGGSCPRNIKDVSFEFDDHSIQTATLLKKTSDEGGCTNTNYAGEESCAMALTTPVTTRWVKITVDSVYPSTYNGETKDDWGHMGALDIKFWGRSTSTVNGLKESGGIKVCSVEESTNGLITCGKGCEGVMSNSAVMFNSAGPNIQEFDVAEASFSDMVLIPGVRTLSSISASCTLSSTTNAFARLSTDPAGTYYRFDPSVELLENTLETPTPIPVGWDKVTSKSGCATVPKTYQNKDYCVQQPSCIDGGDGSMMEVCGSLGEVASDPATGRLFYLQGNGGAKIANLDDQDQQDIYREYSEHNGKKIVWLNVVLNAPDTLRQRAAWALSQIWVAAVDGLESFATEHWSSFYDIFVRNAFGNVRNILKGVAYSPVMANYLTYRYALSCALSYALSYAPTQLQCSSLHCASLPSAMP